MSVRMELARILIIEGQEQQFIDLKEVDGERQFRIVIGSHEAAAIDRRLKQIPTPRPMTHDLLASVIERMGGQLDHIEINNCQHTIYFAKLHIKLGEKIVNIDCRPSDAIALGIATTVPIFVADHVLDAACQ